MLLLILGVFMSFIPPGDPDYGWHYRYSEFFLTHGRLLIENIYSYTLPNYHWYNSYWLGELILISSHKYLGDTAAGLIFSTVLSFICLKFIKNKTTNYTALVFTFIVLIANLSVMSTTVRPLYFDMFFWLYLLEIFYYQKRNAFFREEYLPFVFLIWANVHAEFTIGLFVYAIWLVQEIWNNYKQKNFGNIKRKLVLFGLSITVTIINPFGFNMLIAIFREIIQIHQPYASEWQSPLHTSPIALIPILFVLPLALGKLKVIQHRWHGILLIIFSLLTVKALYFDRILIILAIPAIIEIFTYFVEKISDQKSMQKIFVYSFLLIYFFIFAQNIYFATSVERWSKHFGYPYEAVQLLKKMPKHGNVFNWFGWGGYLIWQLPEYKTFVDGRMNVWTTPPPNEHHFVDDYIKIQFKPKENIALINYYFEKFDIKYLLNRPDAPITQFLLDNGWTVLFKNEYSILLERKIVYAYRQ